MAQTGETELTAQSIDTDAVTTRVGLVDPATGIWFLRGQNGVVGSFFYGNPGDVPFAGDWNCDGIDTPGLYRQSDGFVYLRNSNTQGPADIRFFFGNPGDYPLAGDFNDDGCDTVSIYRASESRIYVINALGANDGGLGAADFNYVFGNPGDKPFVGDFDGNGEDTVGLHRESTGFVYFRQSNTQGIADEEFFFGDPGDRLVAGDWGVVDDEETPAVFRPSTTTFYFRHTNSQGNADQTLVWGSSTYLPISGNWGTVTPGGPGGPSGPIPLTVSGALPNAKQGIEYSAAISITGGSPPYTIAKTAGHWANISPTGVVSGIPTTLGSTGLQIRVSDTQGAQVFATIPINVVNPCLGIGGPALQCQTLLAFYKATFGNQWVEHTGWFADINPCVWHGILCAAGDAGAVTQIELDTNNLGGTIDTVNWAGLPSLSIFDINENQVTGTIPASLVARPLTILDVGQNGFTNDIPVGLWTKATLTDLDLSDNGFTGPMTDVSAMTAILNIDLSENAFDGELPASIWTRTTLVTLDLAGNLFKGRSPPR